MKTMHHDWKTLLKSPEILSFSVKFFLLVTFPVVAYFQDFVQVFSLALTDPDTQYVLIVPLVVAYFLYKRRKAFLISRKNSLFHDLIGVSLCLLALLVYVSGSYSFYPLQLHLLSLPIFIAGLIMLVLGADVLRLLIFPVTLTAFLSPFPLLFMDSYGGNLIASDATSVAFILRPFLPIEISSQPIVVMSTFTTTGQPIQFSLNAACSGIYSLTAFLFCAAVFGYLATGSLIKKALFAVISVAAAYFLNVFRISTMVVLGHFYGTGLALEFFHATEGTLLAFIGTMIVLYLGTKLLKLSFAKNKTNIKCDACRESETICGKCGHVLQWPKTNINWKRLAIVLLFIVLCADLIVQASAINYNAVINGEKTAIDFNPTTGQLATLSNLTGWSPTFLGREPQAETTLGLKFVGDYALLKGNDSNPVFLIFEVSDLQSRFHTWEGCLNYQAYPINIQKTAYVVLYDQNNNIVNGETIIANAPTLNKTITLLYWFDYLNLRTNQTTPISNIKVTLLEYVDNSNNQTTQTTNIQKATSQLLSLGQDLEKTWSQYKNPNNTFVVDIYKNQEAFTITVTALLILSATSLIAKQFLTRTRARRKIAELPEPDKTLLEELKRLKFKDSTNQQQEPKNIPAEKMEEFRQKGILHEKISAKNDELYLEWKPY
ncbi:MAG: exosortase/archaeosortase family protein [Candidatus Bathyarchaeia archaeon]|jgi:exosortase